MRAAAFLLLAFAVAGCADPPVTPPQDDLGRYVILMTERNTFDPPNAKVPDGATVVWRNVAPQQPEGFECTPKSPFCHDVGIVEGDVQVATSWDLGRETALLRPGEEWTWKAIHGRYTVFCHEHHDPERMIMDLRVG
jgi:hypothetical protein